MFNLLSITGLARTSIVMRAGRKRRLFWCPIMLKAKPVTKAAYAVTLEGEGSVRDLGDFKALSKDRVESHKRQHCETGGDDCNRDCGSVRFAILSCSVWWLRTHSMRRFNAALGSLGPRWGSRHVQITLKGGGGKQGRGGLGIFKPGDVLRGLRSVYEIGIPGTMEEEKQHVFQRRIDASEMLVVPSCDSVNNRLVPLARWEQCNQCSAESLSPLGLVSGECHCHTKTDSFFKASAAEEKDDTSCAELTPSVRSRGHADEQKSYGEWRGHTQ